MDIRPQNQCYSLDISYFWSLRVRDGEGTSHSHRASLYALPPGYTRSMATCHKRISRLLNKAKSANWRSARVLARARRRAKATPEKEGRQGVVLGCVGGRSRAAAHAHGNMHHYGDTPRTITAVPIDTAARADTAAPTPTRDSHCHGDITHTHTKTHGAVTATRSPTGRRHTHTAAHNHGPCMARSRQYAHPRRLYTVHTQ